jgi:uncharacterized protein (DUF952 family)
MMYHIVREKDYLTQAGLKRYIPAGMNELGFVHCALEASVISIANDYYSDIEDKLILLRIDPLKLESETRYEAAAPIKGAGTGHAGSSSVFPHVCGPIDNSAVTGIGVLKKVKNGYKWPGEFVSLTEYLKNKIIS